MQNVTYTRLKPDSMIQLISSTFSLMDLFFKMSENSERKWTYNSKEPPPQKKKTIKKRWLQRDEFVQFD